MLLWIQALHTLRVSNDLMFVSNSNDKKNSIIIFTALFFSNYPTMQLDSSLQNL